jgi:pilin
MNAEQMASAIGPRADYYARQFAKFEHAGRTTLPTWNWAAFFFSTPWFTYRRLDGYAVVNFFLPIVFLLLAMILAHGGGFLAWLIGGAYVAIAFVLVPMYANGIYYRRIQAQFARATAPGADAEKEWPRPPSAWKLFSAVFAGALALIVPAYLAVVPAAYDDYAPRAKVAEGVSAATVLQREIDEFYAEHKRLPGPQEQERFRFRKPMQYTQSIAYDAERRMLVVTMGDSSSSIAGKRFALHARDERGVLDWACRTIDLDRKYLPSACRE